MFAKLAASTKRVVAMKGGAGSSKSYSIAQWLIKPFTEQPSVKIGIMRKTFPALRRTAYELMVTLLKDYGVYPLCQHDKTNHVIRYNDALMDFVALDDREKLKSADYNYLWDEEATEFDYEDFLQQDLRLRAPAPKGCSNRILLSFNPTDANCWIATKLPLRDDVEFIHSTYKDNPFLDEEYIKSLEALIDQDDNYYRVYVLGEWGRLENLIITKYDQVDAIPQGCKWVYGLDFGYTHETALTRVAQDEKGGVYLDERIYKTKLTNADLIELLSHEDKADIYADSAEPQRIEEIHRAGYNIYPANKDVKFGLDLMTRQMLHITRQSSNGLKEIRGYRRKKDKNGTILDEPVKFMDHFVDSARYGLAGLVERYGSAVSQSNPNRWKAISTLTFASNRRNF